MQYSDIMLLIALILALLMGGVLGLLGGGGSILTLPILVYILGLSAKQAIATSLLVVAVTSIAGLIQHARAKNVAWRTGLVFSASAMTGAYLSGRVAAYIPGDVLMFLFIAMMVIAGIAMLRSRKDSAAQEPKFSLALILLEGFVVGGFTGLVGAGGGFVVVPALVLFSGMPMRKAVGTSLLVIALKSLAGAAGHLSHVSIDFSLAAMITAVAVVGTLIGSQLAQRIAADKLRKAFAVLVLSMAAVMLVKELPLTIRSQVDYLVPRSVVCIWTKSARQALEADCGQPSLRQMCPRESAQNWHLAVVGSLRPKGRRSSTVLHGEQGMPFGQT
jgi:uncharacterized protein